MKHDASEHILSHFAVMFINGRKAAHLLASTFRLPIAGETHRVYTNTLRRTSFVDLVEVGVEATL